MELKDDPIQSALLYGKSDRQGIVGLAMHPDGNKMQVWNNHIGRTEFTLENFYPFFWLKDINLLNNFPREQYRWVNLEGDNYYQVLVVFNNWFEMWGAKKQVLKNLKTREWKRKEIYMIASAESQWLMQTGNTMFKGRGFDDVHRLQCDIEAYSRVGFPNASRETDKIFIISMCDNKGFDVVFHIAPKGVHTKDSIRFDTEKEMLEEWVETIQALDPDIIEGHNFLSFDMPYLMTRCERYGIEVNIGRDGSVPTFYDTQIRFAERQIEYPAWTIAGRHIIDTYFLVLAFDVVKRSMQDHTLKGAAKYFGFASENREYIQGDQIAKTWDEDPERVLRYALDDVYETRSIGKHLGGSHFALSQMVPMTYERIARGGSATKVEHIMVREYLEKRHSIPTFKAGRMEVGGYTDIFKIGVYENIVYADVESLYPSIMLNYDVKPSTDTLNTFPRILRELTDLRLATKAEMKALEDLNGKPLTGRKKEHESLDHKQAAYKIQGNSMYGALGFNFFIFNDFIQADRVCTIGQGLLKKMLREIIKDGGQPIACDSVAAYTPVYIRRGDDIDVVSIATLHDSDELRRFDGYDGIEVLTRSGWKPIKYTKRHNTDKRMLEVRTMCGTVVVTEDHSLFREDGEMVKPRDLIIGDKLEIIDLPILPNNEEGDYEHGWLLGIMVAEGSTSRVSRKPNGWSTNVSCAEKDKDLLQLVCDLAFKYYRTRMMVYDTMKSTGCNKATGGYNIIQYNIWNNLLYDEATHQKKVPSVVLNGSKEMKHGFFDGAMKGDGHFYKDGTGQYTTKSHILAAGMWWLMRDLELSHRINVHVRKDKETIVRLGTLTGTRRIKYESSEVRALIERKTGLDVYDISTEDGTFVGGVGGILCKNTDGTLCIPPKWVYNQDHPEGKAVAIIELKHDIKGPFPMGDRDWVESLTKRMPSGIVVGFDGRATSMLSLRKKNYALVEGRLKIKGGSFKSRVIELFRREFVVEIITAILERDPVKVHEIYTRYWTKVFTSDWTIDEFCKRSTVKDPLSLYDKKVKLGVGNGGRNADAGYEVAKRIHESGKHKVVVGDRFAHYCAAPKEMKVYKIRAFQHSKWAEEHDPDNPDENTNWYLKKLMDSAKKFGIFFTEEGWRMLFSEQTDPDFDYNSIEIVQRDVKRKPMQVIIAGGRDINDIFWIERAIAGAPFLKLIEKADSDPSGNVIAKIIQGGAKGVDAAAKEYAVREGIDHHEEAAQWNNFEVDNVLMKRNVLGVPYNALAGHNRNQLMAEKAMSSIGKNGAALIAVWNGTSRGTRDMIETAKKAGMRVHVSLVPPKKHRTL